jgi:hypothetical protein
VLLSSSIAAGHIGNTVTLLPNGLLYAAGGCDKHRGSYRTVAGVSRSAVNMVRMS